jgi:hypothetical protein
MKFLEKMLCVACSLAAIGVFAAEGDGEGPDSIISSYNLTKWYNADGTAMHSDGGGGNGKAERIFDGNFTNYQMLPRCGNGGYFILDFSTVASDGYYITKIKVGHSGVKKYSIYYSEDGSIYLPVEGASKVTHSGIATYELGKIAKTIKYVFDEGSMWDYDTEYIAEVEVWGMDPFLVECTHPSYTDWVSVPNTATCTEMGLISRSCTVCGEVFTITGGDRLGHSYSTVLTKKGKYVAFGTGYVECSRCDFYIDFSEPIDLVTNKVNGTPLGSIAVSGKVQFTDVSVSSECHPEWGPSGGKVVDGIFEIADQGWSWWFAYGLENNYVDYKFGTKLDITQIDVSVHNRTQTLQLFDYDEATGIETFIDEIVFTKIPDETNLVEVAVPTMVQKQVQAQDEEGNLLYDQWNQPIMVGAVDEDGNPIMEQLLDSNGAPIYETSLQEVVTSYKHQHIQYPLYEKQTSYLRVRLLDEVGMYMGGWGPSGNTLVELHPWGTVPGAGRPQYRKETLILMK